MSRPGSRSASLRFAARCPIRNVVPFAGREVDDAIVASASAAPGLCESRPGPSAQRRDEQAEAQEAGDKSGKYQDNPADQRGRSGALEVQRPQAIRGEGGAEPCD